MSAIQSWAIGHEAENRRDVRFGESEPLRSTAATDIWWQIDDDPISNSPTPVAPPTRVRMPRFVRTLMSDTHLREHGLNVFRHDASSWILPLDADTLVDEWPSTTWLPSICERIEDLRALAIEEEEAFSEGSAQEALAFARMLKATQRPGVFLIGNGNLRLLWTAGEEQIGLQFRGDGSIQYVLFARRGDRVTTHMGDDDSRGILRQITAAGLRHLLGHR